MERITQPNGALTLGTAAIAGFGLFLAGLGTGIALTLLSAPLSGAETRKLIGRKVKEGEGWVKGQAVAAEEFVHTTGTHLRDSAKDVSEILNRY